MKLDFSLGDIDQLWIDGALPSMLRQMKNNDVKAQLSGKVDSPFPSALVPTGDLLCSERPSPLQHAVTLLLSYPHSITPSPAVQDDNGWWSIPGSTVYGQIRIPLSSEAIAQIHRVESDDHQYELTLEDVELVNKTPRKFIVRGSESDYDALELALTSAGVIYERSELMQFSVDPTHATIITIAVTTGIKALARVLTTYLRERKRRIVVVKTVDGSQLAADNYNVEEIERLLRAASEHSDGHIHIEENARPPRA